LGPFNTKAGASEGAEQLLTQFDTFAYFKHFRPILLSQPLYFLHNITFSVEQGVSRRKIRLIEGNAKSRHVKN
jgi:hypothetical protein